MTGESTNVEKKTVVLEGEKALGDRINMVYSGSLVTGGRAVVLVTATGMETEIGKIAALMNATKEKRTPLQVSLDKFGSQLGHCYYDYQCSCVCLKSVQEDAGTGFIDVCGSPLRWLRSLNFELYCDHCTGHGNTEDGQGTCYYQRSESSGEPRMCICHLFGQNRYADAEQNDGSAGLY